MTKIRKMLIAEKSRDGWYIKIIQFIHSSDVTEIFKLIRKEKMTWNKLISTKEKIYAERQLLQNKN